MQRHEHAHLRGKAGDLIQSSSFRLDPAARTAFMLMSIDERQHEYAQ